MGRSALILAAVFWGCPSNGVNVVLQRDGGPVCGRDPTDQVQYPDCATGTRCVNRICVPTCTGGTACPSGTYCGGPAAPEDVCTSVAASTCATTADCPTPQKCLVGFCASAQLRADGGFQGCVRNDPNDACGTDAVCYALVTSSGGIANTCVGLPGCSQDGGCPVGPLGGVCNDGNLADGGPLIPGKGRICLATYCVRETDCNSTWHCFHRTPQPLGNCSFGQVGDPCFTNADCINSSGCTGADGGLLDGGVPGACH